MQTDGDQTGDMRDVGPEQRTDVVCDRPHPLEVNDAGVGRSAGRDQLGAYLTRHAQQLIVVDMLSLAVDAIGRDVEVDTGEVERMAMREMAALVEFQAEDALPRLERGQVDDHVRLCARMWLHVGPLRAEELLGTLDGQRLDQIHVLAATIIAATRKALGVFVGEDRALGLEHRLANVVLRGDQLDTVALASSFRCQRGGNLGILPVELRRPVGHTLLLLVRRQCTMICRAIRHAAGPAYNPPVIRARMVTPARKRATSAKMSASPRAERPRENENAPGSATARKIPYRMWIAGRPGRKPVR